MDKIAKTLKNISNKVYIVEKWVLMIAVIAVTAVNFVNVIMRYIFKSGLAYLVCLLLGSIALVQHTAQYNQQVATLPITYLQLYSLLIIGSILMLFDHVVVLFKHLAAIQTGVEEEAE